MLTGDVDVNGDFVVDYFRDQRPITDWRSHAFGFLDSGGATDFYDFRFTVTGGQLASAGFFAGSDIGVPLRAKIRRLRRL